MKFIKYLFALFALNIILSSCGTFTDATDVLRNEKIKSTDEFLVKKRAPLTQPPNFEKMPQPNSIKVKKDLQSSKLKEILRSKNSKVKNNQSKSSSTIQSILNQIK